VTAEAPTAAKRTRRSKAAQSSNGAAPAKAPRRTRKADESGGAPAKARKPRTPKAAPIAAEQVAESVPAPEAGVAEPAKRGRRKLGIAASPAE
jgi:hypothetical protein